MKQILKNPTKSQSQENFIEKTKWDWRDFNSAVVISLTKMADHFFFFFFLAIFCFLEKENELVL